MILYSKTEIWNHICSYYYNVGENLFESMCENINFTNRVRNSFLVIITLYRYLKKETKSLCRLSAKDSVS